MISSAWWTKKMAAELLFVIGRHVCARSDEVVSVYDVLLHGLLT
jgi:hypothetical protein